MSNSFDLFNIFGSDFKRSNDKPTISAKLYTYNKNGFMDTLYADEMKGLCNIKHYEPIGKFALSQCYEEYFEPECDPFEIEDVIFNDPATIVYWKDGTKTVVKKQDEDNKCKYDQEKGLAMCFAKKALGNAGNYFEVFKKYCDMSKPKKGNK